MPSVSFPLLVIGIILAGAQQSAAAICARYHGNKGTAGPTYTGCSGQMSCEWVETTAKCMSKYPCSEWTANGHGTCEDHTPHDGSYSGTETTCKWTGSVCVNPESAGASPSSLNPDCDAGYMLSNGKCVPCSAGSFQSASAFTGSSCTPHKVCTNTYGSSADSGITKQAGSTTTDAVCSVACPDVKAKHSQECGTNQCSMSSKTAVCKQLKEIYKANPQCTCPSPSPSPSAA